MQIFRESFILDGSSQKSAKNAIYQETFKEGPTELMERKPTEKLE